MKNQILASIHDPEQLEKLYRRDSVPFKQEFMALYPQHKGELLAEYWHMRLIHESDDISWGSSKELILVIIISFVAGLIAKLPAFIPIQEDFFYPRNIGFIVFPALSAYFAWKNKIRISQLALLIITMLIGLVYINILPDNNSDTLLLACIHLPLLLWVWLGVTYSGNHWKDSDKRLAYFRYNGELVIITTLILIAGAILTGITIGLFALIGFEIEKFYTEYIAIFGLTAAPVIGTYITQVNPQLVNKVSPMIARIFSPLVLLTLVVYLMATVFSAKDPYNNRDFLLLFNVMLIGVMALIFFSVAESSRKKLSASALLILLLLSIVTIVVNSIALSAILFRISEWGLTPNRLAVMGGNILILINLLLVTAELYKAVRSTSDTMNVSRAIANYLPVYFIWALFVVFLFPLLFHFS